MKNYIKNGNKNLSILVKYHLIANMKKFSERSVLSNIAFSALLSDGVRVRVVLGHFGSEHHSMSTD